MEEKYMRNLLLTTKSGLCMNKILLFLLSLGMLYPSFIEAQRLRIEYYQWTKTYDENGNSKTMDGKSGQFVTRTQKVCYDSDKDGCTVKNGSLKLTDQQGNISKYVGPSYYGSPTTYTFYDDKGILNIQDKDGKVYVYKKTTAPQGCKTSSLIASKRNNNSANSGGNNSSAAYVPPVDVGGSSSNSGSSSTKGKTFHPHACRQCCGRGKCHVCNGDGLYQLSLKSGKTKCFSCNGTGICRQCNGTGKFGGEWY